MTSSRYPIIIAALASALLSVGCKGPAPSPPADAPPAPRAAQATQLRDAIQAPQDKARAIEATLQEGADAQRAQIEAAGG